MMLASVPSAVCRALALPLGPEISSGRLVRHALVASISDIYRAGGFFGGFRG